MRNDARTLVVGWRIETIAALAGLALLAIGCVLVLKPFFSALLWAMILAYATWPAYAGLEARLQHRRSLAALLMTLALVLGFVLPLALVATTMADTVTAGAESVRQLIEYGPPPPPPWVVDLPLFGPELDAAWRQFASDTVAFAAFIKPYIAPARDLAIQAGLGIGAAVLEISLSVLAAFFLYRDGIEVVDRVRYLGQRILGERAHHLLLVTGDTIRGVIYGVVGTAIAQGILAGIGFYLAGIPGGLFLGFVTFILGLIPMGPPLVWIPAAFWLLWTGQLGWAVFLGIYGFFVISGVDNLLRPYLISRESRMPLLLVFLGVIGGALAFGFIGIFLGPTLLGVAFALVAEWSTSDRPEAGEAGGPVPTPVEAEAVGRRN
ncbi:AI-2E family transporter [Benzoatithermus flavus]|uniref:AI-2E family transporter n=1 Tax=Benzoatithermus flavus TaxID=3108223 RepID=A0ABU8XTY2_9PROT